MSESRQEMRKLAAKTKQTLKALGIDDKKINEKLSPPLSRAMTGRSQPDDIIEKLILASRNEMSSAGLKLSLGFQGCKVVNAILNEDIGLLRELVDSDNVNQPFGKFEMTALHIAAAIGSLAACQALLAIEGIELSRADKSGNTALMLAVQGAGAIFDTDLLGLIKCLIGANNDTLFKKNSGGAVAIHFAALEGNENSLRHLTEPQFLTKYSIEHLMAAMTLAGHFGHDSCVGYLMGVLDKDDKIAMTFKLNNDPALKAITKLPNSWAQRFLSGDNFNKPGDNIQIVPKMSSDEKVKKIDDKDALINRVKLKKVDVKDESGVMRFNFAVKNPEKVESNKEKSQKAGPIQVVAKPRQRGIKGLRFPQYQELKDRLETFYENEWTDINDSINFEPLAEAGFYYEGIDDEVRCFHCAHTVRKWKAKENPWLRHIMTNQECEFVYENKDFLNRNTKAMVKKEEVTKKKIKPKQITLSEVVVTIDEVDTSDNDTESTEDTESDREEGDSSGVESKRSFNDTKGSDGSTEDEDNNDLERYGITKANENSNVDKISKKQSVSKKLPSLPSSSSDSSKRKQLPDPDLIPRDQIERGRKIAEGGFGDIYKGTYLGTECAIKTIKIPSFCLTERDKLAKEATMLSSLRHPNIVPCFGISYDGDDLWMIMELINGKDLFDLLLKEQQQNLISEKDKYSLCLQVCNAIKYLHDDKKFIHNDIKPENVLVQIQNQTPRAFLSDFGIARYLGGIDYLDYLSKYTSELNGTIQYLAPELIVNEEGKGYRRPSFESDIWSLGILFAEIFLEDTLFNTNERYLYKMKKQLPRCFYELPDQLQEVLKKCLDLNSGNRPKAKELTLFFKNNPQQFS